MRILYVHIVIVMFPLPWYLPLACEKLQRPGSGARSLLLWITVSAPAAAPPLTSGHYSCPLAIVVQSFPLIP